MRFAAATDDGLKARFVNVDTDVRGLIGYGTRGMLETEAELRKVIEYSYVFQSYDDLFDTGHETAYRELEALAKAQ